MQGVVVAKWCALVAEWLIRSTAMPELLVRSWPTDGPQFTELKMST